MNIPAGKIVVALIFIGAILFGIALLGNGEGSSPRATSPKPQATVPPATETSPPTSPKYNWELSGLTYNITEKGETWWKFAWQATLKNNTSHQVEFFIEVNFLDKDGFIVDDDIENPSTFNPNEQRVVRGYALIDIEIAPDVKSIEAEVTAYIID